MMIDDNPCVCQTCEGKGECADENCTCYGCSNGTHTIEIDCGASADTDCEKCDGTGYKRRKGKCPSCEGIGLLHSWSMTGKQQTFDSKVYTVYVCSVCHKEKGV